MHYISEKLRFLQRSCVGKNNLWHLDSKLQEQVNGTQSEDFGSCQFILHLHLQTLAICGFSCQLSNAAILPQQGKRNASKES